MANVTTDKITETFNGQNPVSTTVSGTRAIGGTTLSCASLSGWPTNTAVHFATYQKDSTGAKVSGSQVDWKGVVSGSSINSLTRQGGAADGGNSVGDIVEMMPTYSWAQDLASGLENQHNNDGSHKAITATSLTTTGGVTAGSGLTMSAGTFSLTGLHSGWVGASESWTLSSSDATNATYVITVPSDATTKYSAGMRIKLTDGSTKYFIVTKVSSTQLTVWGGTDYTLSGGAITNPFYSSQKAPQGFPLDPTKWTVSLTDTSDHTASVGTTWVNTGALSLSFPIGAWLPYMSGSITAGRAQANTGYIKATLSTANNTESNANNTIAMSLTATGATTTTLQVPFEKHLDVIPVTSATTYYLNFFAQATNTVGVLGSEQPTIIRAVCAYL